MKLRTAFALVAIATPALADAPVVTDAVAVRFFAPDMGGAAKPRFVTRRQLSFEARLLALEEDPTGVVTPRHAHAAVEAHISEEMLRALPLDHPADSKAVAETVTALRLALEQRVGKPGIERAEKVEGVEPSELDAILDRQARAALYVDRAVTPILAPNEDQLRETYRTTSHPFRGKPFEEVRDDLSRWVVVERFRSAEQAYLQSARARVTVVYF
ncbi:MAG TPA: hypothetical protein VH054_02610 [Polyangiaceae bacterium]|nr:hypothetical protein [Polyangiaceae bacterium]